MKIVKNASGEKVVKMSRKEWEDLGKQAGWLKEASEEGKIVKEAQPAAPVKEAPPKKAPAGNPDPKKSPGERKRRNPNPGVNPDPKGESEEVAEENDDNEVVEASEEVSPENLPTIASELRKFKKKG